MLPPRIVASWRCAICNINYPPDVPFRRCAVCDGVLSAMYETAPHMDWQRRVEELRKIRGEAPPPEQYPNVETKLRKHRRSKTLWVKKDVLLEAGYMNLRSFQVVRINEKYYEIQGYDSKKREFWIEEIKETFDEKDLYSGLDRIGA